MKEKDIYEKALLDFRKKNNENDKLVLLIQSLILGLALIWEVRKRIKKSCH